MPSVTRLRPAVRRARSFAFSICVCLLGAGCMPTCSCDSQPNANGAPGTAAVSATQGAAGAAPSANGKPGSGAPSDVANAGTGAPSVASTTNAASDAGPALPVPVRDVAIASVFPDMAGNAKDLRVLRDVQTKLAKPAAAANAAPPLAQRSSLGKLLPGKLGTFSAKDGAVDGPTMAGDQKLAVLARHYADGNRKLYIKVTDTAQAPLMRGPFIEHLLNNGTQAQGYLHSRVIGGYPAIAQYFPQAQASQVMALLGERYLVEVQVTPARSPYEAQEVLSGLPLSALAAPDDAAAASP